MASPQLSLHDVKLAMSSTNRLFTAEVVAKRNFAAFDDIYTLDARILPPGAPMMSGRESIKMFWSNLIPSINATSAVLTSMDVTPAGDGILEIGSGTLTLEPQGQPPTQMSAKYVVYWKQEGSRWKWHVDIWNQNS